MSHARRLPEEPSRFAELCAGTAAEGVQSDQRNATYGLPSRQAGEAGADLDGRFGGLKQSLTNRWQVQDR